MKRSWRISNNAGIGLRGHFYQQLNTSAIIFGCMTHPFCLLQICFQRSLCFFTIIRDSQMVINRRKSESGSGPLALGNDTAAQDYHRHIVSDALLFSALAEGKLRHFKFDEPLDPFADLQMEQYNASSAVTRAFFCLLAAQQPKYLKNADAIPLSAPALSPASAKHRHHIFPRAQL